MSLTVSQQHTEGVLNEATLQLIHTIFTLWNFVLKQIWEKVSDSFYPICPKLQEVLITFQIKGEGLAGKLIDIFDTKNKHREAALYEGLQTVCVSLIWQKQGFVLELLLWYVPRNTFLVGTSTP